MTKPKTMSVDLETYSSVDLSKAGVYRYAESLDFEILLLSYAFDDRKVYTLDLTRAPLQKTIAEALVDPEITKRAWNANFERVCLERYLGKPMPPQQWRDTMIQSAELGLPMSLAAAGKVLGLSEEKLKMQEGKNLIQYFSKPCRPTKANGGRIRNLPEHDPEKWAKYKEYNARDVETEREIAKLLDRYKIEAGEQKLWCIDQEINDRGVMIDRKLAENAARIDEQIKDALKEEARQISGLENPNSVTQIKRWIKERTGVEVESLDKRVIGEVKDRLKDDATISRFLDIRSQLAITSTAKYNRMLECVGDDGRIRGLSQFYGASRTGRWCLTGDHEVLTPDGWIRLDDFAGTMKEILCWNAKTEMLSFQKAKGVQFDHKGEMYCYEQQRVSQIATPDHRMPVLGKDGTWTEKTVGEIGEHQTKIAFTGRRLQQPRAHASAELRILIMTQADGHYTSDGALRFHFSKERKKERCEKLLHDCEIPHTYKNNADGTATITIKPAYIPIWLRTFRSKTFGLWLLDEPADVVFDELVFWDGYAASKNSMQYTTTNRQNADVVQACALCAGYSATLLEKKQRQDGWSTAYYVNIWRNPGQGTGLKKDQITRVAHDGPVYCAETPTGFFAVRRNGKVWITGNSGRNVQLQNLKQNKMPDADLDAARKIVRAGDAEALGLIFDPAPALSELIRTAFIPRPGYKFVVSDFSAIEARVLAWLAGEEWRLEAFDRGEDIYCSSASSMFGVPVEKHGVNGHLRQKGKVAELACIAENSPVLTDKGLVPIQDITTAHLLWDGKEWVSHEGVIDKGVKEVFDYDGLTATGDHLVYIEGQAAPIRFRVAASSGARLAQTGDGGRALWFCGDNQLGEEMEQGVESLLRSDQMHEMRSHKMAAVRQSEIRTSKGLPGLFQSATDPAVARQEADRRETTVRESKSPWLPQLRRAWDRIQILLRHGGGALSNQQVRRAGQDAGDRQDRHGGPLRAGELALRNTRGKQGKPAQDGAEPLRPGLLAIRSVGRNTKAIQRDDPRGDHRGRAQSGTGAKEKLANHTKTARVYDIRNAGRRHRFTVSGRLVHNCGYGGSVGALKAMGALEMGLTENELKPLVDSWRAANRNITKLWWAVDKAAKSCVKYGDRQAIKGGGWNVKSCWNVYKIDGTHEGETFAVSEEQAICNVRFREDLLYSDMADFYAEEIREGPRLAVRMDNMLMRILLPSGREISYAKPKIEGEDLTYEGQIQAGGWGRIETYGPKLVENIIQAISRDCLAESMRRLETAGIPIVFHVHDEVICEVPQDGPSAEDIAQIMGKPITWALGLPMKADAYECQYYRKD